MPFDEITALHLHGAKEQAWRRGHSARRRSAPPPFSEVTGDAQIAAVPNVVNRTKRPDFAPDLKILQPEQQTVVDSLQGPPAESARKSAPAKLSEYHTPPQTPMWAGVLEPRSSIAVLAVLHISTIAAPLLQACRFTALQGAFLYIAPQQHIDAIVLQHYVMTAGVALFLTTPPPYVYFRF